MIPKIFIYVIITIIIVIILSFDFLFKYLNKKNNLRFLYETTHINLPKLEIFYDFCDKYSKLEHLIVESSIKISNKKINKKRFTIPISFANFILEKCINEELLYEFCFELLKLIMDNQNLNLVDRLKSYIMDQITTESYSTDLIVGYDFTENIFKFYINNLNTSMECLEFNLSKIDINRKIYEYLLKNDYKEIIFDLNGNSVQLLIELNVVESNCELIYRVPENIYHVILKNGIKLNSLNIGNISKYFGINKSMFDQLTNRNNSMISVISIKKMHKNINYITFYTRLSNLITKLNYFRRFI